MFYVGPSFFIDADIWCEGTILGDAWCETGSIAAGASGAVETNRITDYYLRQMNFMGNLLPT